MEALKDEVAEVQEQEKERKVLLQVNVLGYLKNYRSLLRQKLQACYTCLESSIAKGHHNSLTQGHFQGQIMRN